MITRSIWSLALALGMLTATAPPAVAVDHDHIAYVRPYAAARDRAVREGRILIVRPFPVGGVADGSRDGRWCPLADYMRAVTLADETVTTLVNRRFVFTYFSLVDWADLADPEAKAAILRVAPQYGAKVRDTPPTFFFAPDGTLLATLDTLAAPEAFRALATRLLAAHPEYARPSREEAALAARAAGDARARLLLGTLQLELADADAAARTLAPLVQADAPVDATVRAEAHLALARRARGGGAVATAAGHLAAIATLPPAATAGLTLDVAIEHAHLHALRDAWAASLAAWQAIESDRPPPERRGEILYAEGLAYYHLGRRREANHSWMRVLLEIPEGRYYQPARLAAMGPAYGLRSPDLVAGTAAEVRRWHGSPDPSRLAGSELGYGTSTRGLAGTEATPERFLRIARRDYVEVERRRAGAVREHGLGAGVSSVR